MKWFGRKTCRHILPATVLLFAVGCGGTGNLAGKVTFKGAPLPGGLVTVTTIADGEVRTYPGRIQSDGSYNVPNVPTGPGKVSVATVKAMGNIQHPEDVKEPYGKWVQIPKHYGNADKSGFKAEIKTGKNELNIDLKDDFEPDEVILENK